MSWLQKAEKENNKNNEMADRATTEYLGPTPMSMLVTDVAVKINNEIDALLYDAAWRDPEKFGGVESLVSAIQFPKARQLAVTLIFVVRANWELRIMMKTSTWPCLFL